MASMSPQQLLCLLLIAAACSASARPDSLHSYAQSCPRAEQIVAATVKSAADRDPTTPAGIIRLFFHDCFVQGCDASILLESTPTDGREVEMFAGPNINSARGFEIIEAAKTQLEAVCPGVVSCADVLAFAARDATTYFGGMFYTVPTGRLDGRISSRTEANSLPGPASSFSQLRDIFDGKKLSVQDLVLLSGGHTIGRAKCRFVEARIYNFSGTGSPDPRLDATYREELRRICPQGANPSPTVALDRNSEFSFDNAYYRNLEANRGLLSSDAVLRTDPDAANLINSLAQNPPTFLSMFAQSMINMGNIEWKTRANGEIRKKCSAVNSRITTEVGDVASF
ncbi:peroxidase A2-like [Selaginella moellendorffii]|uniref:peroxidase A2-like n=1 Tax=Selaginella moellendorffii TaxID=88036 RepID=UPI000D1C6D3E|nr:peroxidase A2-like [Selaginella moellendorffii]|eukprot:XP_024529367.1 peroxidase A2-like [Selaginella moellendorffii]